MKTIKWTLFFYIFLSFVLISNNFAFSENLNIPSKIQFKLNNSEYNKYMRRAMRAYTDGELYGQSNIKKKYKKWVKAKIIVEKKKIDSEIRILGDLKDHLRIPQTSLKVKIINDSFYGITRFNLFLPETRKGENEVFWTLMLKKINFPSLYTRMVEVSLNGNIYKAILQEDATKEFLERNNLTETVILKENDFRFYLNKKENEIYENFFTPSFVIDNNNFLKNDISNFIVSEAISLKLNTNFENRVINEDLFKTIHQKYASHGLGSINRKYIFLPYKKIFLPLYYDGNVQFLPGKINCDGKIKKEILVNFKKDFTDLTNKKLTKMQECVFRDIYNLSKNNTKEVKDFFLTPKFKKKESIEYLNIKNKIIEYLKNNEIKKTTSKKNFLEKMIIYTFIYNDKYFNCYLSIVDKNIKSCNEIDRLTYSNFISESGRFIKTKKFKSFPINLGAFNNEIPIIRLDTNLNKYFLNEKATYFFVAENYSNKDLEFIFQNSKSKLFIKGDFINVNFDFKKQINGEEIFLDTSRYDKNLLTGCANFFDSSFEKTSIRSEGMICEDSINIKNSKGDIENVVINNSLYDALDLDFSKLDIKSININNAKNDCLDFSFGSYKIQNANLTNCGDKGFSVGEKSKLDLENGFVTLSKIGVASKDEAITNIEQIRMKEIDLCLSAYKKKKEFQGSTIKINRFNCNNYKIKQQSDSLSEISILTEY